MEIFNIFLSFLGWLSSSCDTWEAESKVPVELIRCYLSLRKAYQVWQEFVLEWIGKNLAAG